MRTGFITIASFFILAFPATANAQEEKENTITYEAPSDNFIDVTIQAHKGLPRFGDLYYHRGVTPPTNKDAYESLVKMKYLKQVFADMDLNKLTKQPHGINSSDLKAQNSKYAQDHLLRVIRTLGSIEFLKKHFCDTSAATACTFENSNGDRTNPRYWGGSRNNEFQQMRSYRTFTKDYLDELKNWSTTFFKNDQEVVYFVSRSSILGSYDFKKKGFWIAPMGNGSGFILQGFSFLAYTENEKKLKNSSQKIFWAVDPARGKELQLRDRVPIMAVYKVKVSPKVQNNTNVSFHFELASQLVELYRRSDLKDKIGEIDINNLITAY